MVYTFLFPLQLKRIPSLISLASSNTEPCRSCWSCCVFEVQKNIENDNNSLEEIEDWDGSELQFVLLQIKFLFYNAGREAAVIAIVAITRILSSCAPPPQERGKWEEEAANCLNKWDFLSSVQCLSWPAAPDNTRVGYLYKLTWRIMMEILITQIFHHVWQARPLCWYWFWGD